MHVMQRVGELLDVAGLDLTGVDRIDIPAVTKRGIILTNIPDFCINEMADRVGVMYLGRIVEFAPTRRLFSSPILSICTVRSGRSSGRPSAGEWCIGHTARHSRSKR